MLTPEQRILLHADAIARPELATALTNGDDQVVADFYNEAATPSFIAWRTAVDKDEYQDKVSRAGTTFSWAGTGGFITRSPGELSAWRELFGTDNKVDPSRPNVIAAFNDIFSGSGAQAQNNRVHLLSMSKRIATLAEKLLSTGTGNEAVPALLSFEGIITVQEAGQIRAGE